MKVRTRETRTSAEQSEPAAPRGGRTPERESRAESQPKQVPTTSPLLVLLSAPSGGGKTTLCQQLLAARRQMTRAVTCTTRPPREGEQNEVDYYFLDAASFLKRVQAGHFLEHATVFGNSYGTSRAEVLGKLRQGKDVLLSVDVQGAATIRARAEEESELKRALVTVFLTPPSLAVLEERLRKRGTDSPSVIQKRLTAARQEIAQWKNFDYLLLSTSIREDLRRMLAIVEAEKMRAERVQAPEF
ncbi:MAG: guanylate kinase [Verrucomicrobia bacterium]|nr:MAG: guanylate kinase [Verrucomicrobiota bacterium]